MASDKLAITVQVCGRKYTLNIERSQEEYIRKAAKMVEDKVSAYKKHFADKDDQDFLCMTAIAFTFEMLQSRESKGDTALADSVIATIDKIDQAITE